MAKTESLIMDDNVVVEYFIDLNRFNSVCFPLFRLIHFFCCFQVCNQWNTTNKDTRICSPGVRKATHRGGNQIPQLLLLFVSQSLQEVTTTAIQQAYQNETDESLSELITSSCEIGKSPPEWYTRPYTAFVTPSIYTSVILKLSLLLSSLSLINDRLLRFVSPALIFFCCNNLLHLCHPKMKTQSFILFSCTSVIETWALTLCRFLMGSRDHTRLGQNTWSPFNVWLNSNPQTPPFRHNVESGFLSLYEILVPLSLWGD